jgi:hypothetical protein
VELQTIGEKKPAYFVPAQPGYSQTGNMNERKRYSKKEKKLLDKQAGRR